ncbi:Uncharacterised protein [Mycobacteroides abscessus]|nr:Uncharacterised protein [Mycobacteroides abscessus]
MTRSCAACSRGAAALPCRCSVRAGPGGTLTATAAARTGTNRTRAPGATSAGGSRSTSNICTSVLPRRRHPPGDSPG